MAILYGTQSNGETLPVLVDQFGNLLAKGIDGTPGAPGPPGQEGPQGPQGPQGIPGPAEIIETYFTPQFSFVGGGSADISYSEQLGKVVRQGTHAVVTGFVGTNNVTITNPAGKVDITIPENIDVESKLTSKVIWVGKRWKDERSCLQFNQRQYIGVLRPLIVKSLDNAKLNELATADFLEGATSTSCNNVGFIITGPWLSDQEVITRKQLRADAMDRLSEVVMTSDIDYPRQS